MNKYKKYGMGHGTGMYYDVSDPDVEVFLAFMETRIPPAHYEDYLDGFMEGKMGEHRFRFAFMRALRKVGSDDES